MTLERISEDAPFGDDRRHVEEAWRISSRKKYGTVCDEEWC